jgi:putative chitinase
VNLAAIMPKCPDVLSWSAALEAAMLRYAIIHTEQRAGFLANVAHESSQLRVLVENLNYSADQLARTWPDRFANVDRSANALAVDLARKGAQTIANFVYANRMGNGAPETGDGWRFRGAGPLQETGHDNQAQAAAAFGVMLADFASWAQTPAGGSLVAARRWTICGANDAASFDNACDQVNLGHATPKIGDSIGYVSRLAFYNVTLGAV